MKIKILEFKPTNFFWNFLILSNDSQTALLEKTFHGNEFEYAYTFNWEPLRDALVDKETDNDASLLMPQTSSGFKQLAVLFSILA